MRYIYCFLALSSLLPLSSADESFPTPYNSEPDKTASPPSAEESAAMFQLPDGFEVGVFASEPDVQNPIALTWDARGRMWVAENYTYAEKKTRFDLSLRDRVIIFEDSDWDGKADRRTVFSDDLQMLTSVEVGRGGVWLMCPPQLLFIPDRDGDDVPDGEPEVMLDGFTVAKSNYHNFANGLRWGLDGWLYGRCGHSCPGRLGVPGTPDEKRIPIDGGIWRFHPERKTVEVLTHGTTNPWGHDWDENGQGFFINTVIGHLWHMIPGAHFRESFGNSDNPLIFDRIGMHADHWHFDTSGGWMASRDGKANDLGGGHSHIGMMIYQGEHLPACYHGKLFTWNQHGRRANVEKLERSGSGYVGRHEPDVFLANDEWFRGLDIRTGPAGAVYALDWSDTGECHEHTGVHRTSGRIYRFTHGEIEKPDFSMLEDLDAEKLEAALRRKNPWFWRQLMAEPSQVTPFQVELKNLATASNAPVSARLRAMGLLKALGAEAPVFLDAENEHLRCASIRFLSDFGAIDTLHGKPGGDWDSSIDASFDRLLEMAEQDESGLVRLTLASTLQRLPHKKRAQLAAALASREEDAADHNLPKMVWFGIHPLTRSNPDSLLEIASATEWSDLLRWIARALGSDINDHPHLTQKLLEVSLAMPEKAPSVLGGLDDAFQGWRKAPKPGNWEKVVSAFPENDTVRQLSVLFGDGRAAKELEAIVLDKERDFAAREQALRTLIDIRPPNLRELCESLLHVRNLNKTAVRGLGVFDDPAIGKSLAKDYRKFWPKERPAVIDVLVSRKEWALALLERMEAGSIPREALTPFHARQMVAIGDAALEDRLREVWGEIRQSDQAKRQRMEELKQSLSADVVARADLSQGRLHYQTLCSACHQLYGEGGKLGPDLTGSGRANLDYLLENMVDPSAVVGADYRVTTITTSDGRVLSGVVASENKQTLSLRLLNEETILEKRSIEKREVLPTSMMPEGLLRALQPDQIRDLIGYLQYPRQVPLPE
ncbi:MAG: PVC-type heme-binding CxxCH protein [Verrucomicrobiota bacterium]